MTYIENLFHIFLKANSIYIYKKLFGMINASFNVIN
jgi:hypothetical protein